jgi:predicted permease
MSTFVQDVRYGARMLLNGGAVTLVAIVTLALGIGANTAIFSIVNGILLKPLPFERPGELVLIAERHGERPISVSWLNYVDWKAGNRVFSEIGATNGVFLNLVRRGAEPERLNGARVTASYFRTLGVPPLLGRTFTPSEDEQGGEPAVVLGEGAWHRLFGGDPAIVGTALTLSGTPHTVIGVMPAAFAVQNPPVDAWVSLGRVSDLLGDRGNHPGISVVARLSPGATLERARADLGAIAAQLAEAYPATNADIGVRIDPLHDRLVGQDLMRALLVLLGSVVFVLLIACANVANLLLARAAVRSREVAVRMSMGASRWRIVRQLLVESLLLAAMAGALALALSAAGIRLFWEVISRVPDPPPFWLRFPVDGQVVAFLAGVCLATSVVFGLVPALHTSRTNLVEVLNEGARGGGNRRGRRWSGALVVAQLALALVLLTGAGLMMQNLLMLVRTDAGVPTAGLVRMALELPPTGYASEEQRRAFYRQLDERLAAAGDARVALASAIPLGGAPEGRLLLDDGRMPAVEERPAVSVMTIGPRYFETLGVAIVRGRDFDDGDGLPGREAALVNQRFVEMHLDGGDAIGRRVRLGDESPWLTVVGVTPDVRQRTTVTGACDPIVYQPVMAAVPPRMLVLARGSDGVGRAAALVRDQVRALDADLAVFDVRTVDEHLAMARWGQRVFGSMFAIFAGVALLLAIVGLYAVTAYSVAQRTTEIGVRLALGAGARHVWWTVTRRAAAQLAGGLAIGAAGATGVSRVIPAMLAGSGGGSAVTLLLVAGLLFAAGLLAAFVPARRAMRLDPVAALRAE